MTYTIIKEPHVLDKVWEAAGEAYSDAMTALNNSGDTDEEIDAAADVLGDAIGVILALPARNLADILYKLSCGTDRGRPTYDCDIDAIINEGLDLLNAAMARGRAMQMESEAEAVDAAA